MVYFRPVLTGIYYQYHVVIFTNNLFFFATPNQKTGFDPPHHVLVPGRKMCILQRIKGGFMNKMGRGDRAGTLG
jgi:hypothetical protein